jgi:hypothetical protein
MLFQLSAENDWRAPSMFGQLQFDVHENSRKVMFTDTNDDDLISAAQRDTDLLGQLFTEHVMFSAGIYEGDDVHRLDWAVK